MTRLQCGCRLPFRSPECVRDATQEDLLCDQCRGGGRYNGVMIHEHGHEHFEVSHWDDWVEVGG
jgi:hypothetical protein